MIAWSNDTVVVSPSAPSTASMFGSGEARLAGDDLHLAALGHLLEAAGELGDDALLPARAARRGRSPARRSAMPCAPAVSASAMTLATCSSALDGMQPTLRQTPPSARVALDHHDVEAEVGSAERGRVAARAGAQDQRRRMDVAVLHRTDRRRRAARGGRLDGAARPATPRPPRARRRRRSPSARRPRPPARPARCPRRPCRRRRPSAP